MSNDVLTKEEQNEQIAIKNGRTLDEQISRVDQFATESNEKMLVAALLKSARRAYQHLFTGRKDNDSTQAAWACRNLLELRIFAKYIVQSEANRKRFIQDFFIDMEQMAEVQKKITIQVAPDISIDENDAFISGMRKMQKELGAEGHEYLRAREEARTLGLEEEFNVMNKVCSKYVHPTALSIWSIERERGGTLNGVLVGMGCKYLAELLIDLIPFIQTLPGMPALHPFP